MTTRDPRRDPQKDDRVSVPGFGLLKIKLVGIRVHYIRTPPRCGARLSSVLIRDWPSLTRNAEVLHVAE